MSHLPSFEQQCPSNSRLSRSRADARASLIREVTWELRGNAAHVSVDWQFTHGSRCTFQAQASVSYSNRADCNLTRR